MAKLRNAILAFPTMGVRAVESRERMDGIHTTELLVHVHRVQQRLGW
jgi:hypothetical protein